MIHFDCENRPSPMTDNVRKLTPQVDELLDEGGHGRGLRGDEPMVKACFSLAKLQGHEHSCYE